MKHLKQVWMHLRECYWVCGKVSRAIALSVEAHSAKEMIKDFCLHEQLKPGL